MRTRDNALVIMTKAPVPGQTKTRLVPPLSFDDAAELALALFQDQLQNLSHFPHAHLFLAYTPAEASEFFAPLYPRELSFPQQGSSLGDRMRHAIEELFAREFRRVVLIGGDLPALPCEILLDAFTALADAGSKVVLGPALDGGYYLIGMNRPVDAVFSDIEWSRDDVFASTVRKLKYLNTGYKLVSSWYDVDTVDDLRRIETDFSGARSGTMENTLDLLKKFREGGRLS